MVINEIPLIHDLELSSVPRGEIRRFWLQIVSDGMGWPIALPIMVARGAEPGPVIGLTAAVHGNELNGVPVIQQLFSELQGKHLRGTVVGLLVVNVPGLLNGQRKFNDGVDPNHIMPGDKDGNNSQVFAYRLLNRVVNRFDYLIDIHTASFGRVNSFYIRADLENTITRKMALLQNADIIVHNPPRDGTLRGAAEEIGIKAITVEVGDSHRFQKGMIRSSLTGIDNFLIHLGILEGEVEDPENPPVICDSSYWTYTAKGGLLTVKPQLTQMVKKGEKIGELSNVFGDVIQEYLSPEDGIVIGKSTNPINQSGGRILHLGVVDREKHQM